MPRKKQKIFFDMDGVLNVFERGAPYEKVCEEGYMLNREPQSSVIVAAFILSLKYSICVASAALPFPYTIPEKEKWLDMHAPFIRSRYFVTCGKSKAELLTEAGARTGDLFIDDYTFNLNDVSKNRPDLCCVKCVNGINDTHKTWKGKRVSAMWSPLKLAWRIDRIAKEAV